MFTLTETPDAGSKPYNRNFVTDEEEATSRPSSASNRSRTAGTSPGFYQHTTTNNAGPMTTLNRMGASSISGKPLYETTGDEDNCLCKCCMDRTLNVQFFPHAVVIRRRKKICCFPSVKSTTIIPRYKLTDVMTGAGGRSVPAYVWIMFMASALLIVIGSLMSECSFNSFTGGTECGLTGGGIALVIFGCLFLLPSIALMAYYLKGKDNYYILQYSEGRSGSSWFASASHVDLELDDKPNEDFLYNYVYESIEKAKDPHFLHRFSHLYRVGLMEAVKDKSTPDELKTAV